MDITAFVSKQNKAGIALVDILTKDNNEKEFHKIVSLLNRYCCAIRELISANIFNDYFYNLVYDDYKNRITTNINEKYSSYVLNILHTKYKNFYDEVTQLRSLYDNTDNVNDDENKN